GWLYAAGTAVVIVGTGNHWVIDVIMGWLVVIAGFAVAEVMGSTRGPDRVEPQFEVPLTGHGNPSPAAIE
ncbi:MAG: integral rane protein, partial [Nocardioides sp.]|nr:integral rane protein [Nocardioides sp.]